MPVTKGTTTEDFYPDRWLKGDDIPEEGQYFRVMDVTAEEIGEKKEMKLILQFRESPKELILNKTNAKRLEALFGHDPNGWIDKRIKIVLDSVTYLGKTSLVPRIFPKAPAQKDEATIKAELGYDENKKSEPDKVIETPEGSPY
jgi:hypothetical protein